MEDLRKGGERISEGEKGKGMKVTSTDLTLNFFSINNFLVLHKYFVN